MPEEIDAIGKLDEFDRVPKVHLRVQQGADTSEWSWQPVTRKSIYPLLLE